MCNVNQENVIKKLIKTIMFVFLGKYLLVFILEKNDSSPLCFLISVLLL